MARHESTFRDLARTVETHDADAVLAFFAEDAVLIDYTDPSTRREGRPAIRAFLTELFAAFSGITMEIVSVVEQGDRLATQTIVRGTPGGHSEPLEMHYAAFYTFRGGLILTEEVYVDSAQTVPSR